MIRRHRPGSNSGIWSVGSTARPANGYGRRTGWSGSSKSTPATKIFWWQLEHAKNAWTLPIVHWTASELEAMAA